MPPIPLVRWTFHDPTVPETYTLEINPNEGGAPDYKKSITTMATAAPDGSTLMFEGRDEPKRLDFSGVILTEAQYMAFLAWWQKRHQILVTDDLGREYWVYFEQWTPTRKRTIHYPWRHNFQAKTIILDVS